METANSLKTLIEVKAGEKAIVKELRGGRGFVARVASLGLIPGAEVEVIRNPGHGPIIIRVKGSYFALGRGEAAKVLVEDSA
jgi:ferrous iron transport protein A